MALSRTEGRHCRCLLETQCRTVVGRLDDGDSSRNGIRDPSLTVIEFDTSADLGNRPRNKAESVVMRQILAPIHAESRHSSKSLKHFRIQRPGHTSPNTQFRCCLHSTSGLSRFKSPLALKTTLCEVLRAAGCFARLTLHKFGIRGSNNPSAIVLIGDTSGNG